MEPPSETSDETARQTYAAVAPGPSAQLASSIVFGGCGTIIDAAEPYPFRCPRSGDGGDHVLRRVLDVARLDFPSGDSEPNPFVRWRGLFHSYHLSTAHGLSDKDFVQLVRELDSAV